MTNPANLKYTITDEWVKVEGQTATVGVTDFAQEQLSDVVYFEAAGSVGDKIKQGQPAASIESVKAAAEVKAPVSGTILEVNEDLGSSPEKINSDPYGEAWMLKITLSNIDELSSLMDATAYEDYCSKRGH
jgi:glycine cleavage system H protein